MVALCEDFFIIIIIISLFRPTNLKQFYQNQVFLYST